MTFILNVIHGDYSLLAADRQANTDGPTTIKMGNVTIHAERGATIEGFRKLRTSKCLSLAVGIAGTTQGHRYFDSIDSLNGSGVLHAILEAPHDEILKFNPNHYSAGKSVMQNEGIATYFDEAADQYLSLLYIFSPVQSALNWNFVSKGRATLVHVGSGSSALEKAVGLASINDFIEQIRTRSDPTECLDWIRETYKKVSLVAEGVGNSPEFLVSTRTDRAFRQMSAAQTVVTA